jgi:hypothetical protein
MHTLDGRDTIEVHLEYKGVEYNKDRLGRVDDMKTSGTWYMVHGICMHAWGWYTTNIEWGDIHAYIQG